MRVAEIHRPKVFISYSRKDEKMARIIGEGLDSRGFNVFIDQDSVDVGKNVMLAINDALAQSDYCVLLWSQACADSEWIRSEWSAALARELSRRRSFLFIVKLDNSDLPTLLAPRQYLETFGNCDKALNDLTAAWHRDRAVNVPVLPAPEQGATRTHQNGRPAIVVYIRNQALSVAHTLAVPATLTGGELDRLVRAGLALPEIETKFDGQVGLRFHYRLKKGNKLIPSDSLAPLDIVHHTTIDLEVEMEPFAPGYPTLPRRTFRRPRVSGQPRPRLDGSSGIELRPAASKDLSAVVVRSLAKSAFAHLMPQPPGRH